MRSEELLDIVLARPFKPFRFTFTTGETYDLTASGNDDGGTQLSDIWRTQVQEDVRIADRQFHMSLLHIVKVEPIVKGPKSENGKRKNK